MLATTHRTSILLLCVVTAIGLFGLVSYMSSVRSRNISALQTKVTNAKNGNHRPTKLIEWNGFEHVPKERESEIDDGLHDGWEQRRLDFLKRYHEIKSGADPDFIGQNFVQDNLNKVGPHSNRIYNDFDYSWTDRDDFGEGHWDYRRLMYGFDEAPARDGTGKGCSGPPPNGPGCVGMMQDPNPPPQCDPVLGCQLPWDKYARRAGGQNIDPKTGKLLPHTHLRAAGGAARTVALAEAAARRRR